MTRIVTVGRYGARMATTRKGTARLSFPLYAVKVYEARPRMDGKLTYRLVETLDDTATACKGGPTMSMIEKGFKAADRLGLPFVFDVKLGTPAKLLA